MDKMATFGESPGFNYNSAQGIMAIMLSINVSSPCIKAKIISGAFLENVLFRFLSATQLYGGEFMSFGHLTSLCFTLEDFW